jgi:hypothetical protein
LAAKGLDALVLAMRPVTDEGMDLGVGDAMIEAGAIGAGKTVSHDAFGRTSSALEFSPRSNHRRRCRAGCSVQRLTTTGRTVVRGARREQATMDQPIRRLVEVSMTATSPKYNKPEHAHQCDEEGADALSHPNSFG